MERIVITASAGSFPGLAEALSAAGRTVAERPLIHFTPPSDWAPLDQALDRFHHYPDIALTSPRAARALATRLVHRRIRWPLADAPTVWAGGAGTAAALGWNPRSVRILMNGRSARMVPPRRSLNSCWKRGSWDRCSSRVAGTGARCCLVVSGRKA